MPKARQQRGHLARLERQLGEVNARRHRLIADIRKAVEHLTMGSAAPMAGLQLDRPLQAPGRTRRVQRTFSPEARARLSQLAKARWAKAKKAGKSRL